MDSVPVLPLIVRTYFRFSLPWLAFRGEVPIEAFMNSPKMPFHSSHLKNINGRLAIEANARSRPSILFAMCSSVTYSIM